MPLSRCPFSDVFTIPDSPLSGRDGDHSRCRAPALSGDGRFTFTLPLVVMRNESGGTSSRSTALRPCAFQIAWQA